MRFATLVFLMLAMAGVRATADVPPADPDAALRLARELRAKRQPEADRVFAAKEPTARAVAARKFLAAAGAQDPNPVLLDESAAVCSDSARLLVLDQMVGRLPPGDALAISREVAKSASPEERIVAWRNISRLAPNERPAIASRLREILGDPKLARTGSFAYGQAFDGVVALRDVEAIPVLAGLLKDPRVASLAGMTLDRLAEAAPVKTTEYLNAHLDVLADFPLLRADDYAKGSLADPRVRAAVEVWLARPELSERELEKYFFSYVQPGEFLVAGIFTGPPDESGSPESDRVAELQAASAGWRKIPALRRAADARDRALARLANDESEEEPAGR
jgi:hypothetical protein